MQDVVAYMMETELGRFSVNDYRGLPDAPPYVVVEGELPVAVSAPHAVSQLREGRVKPSDDFTGALALAVAYPFQVLEDVPADALDRRVTEVVVAQVRGM